MLHLHTPRKRQNAKSFLAFLGGIEIVNIGLALVNHAIIVVLVCNFLM